MVGGSNQTVMLENYDHIVDALNSSKSSMKYGVVAGGGVTFWRLS
jgi:chaperonin GroEL (HSP60 family)